MFGGQNSAKSLTSIRAREEYVAVSCASIPLCSSNVKFKMVRDMEMRKSYLNGLHKKFMTMKRRCLTLNGVKLINDGITVVL